ncbi:hypothetical protein SEA_CORN21_45 [Microbacterium phage Corn21]|nr:hypothetical protein SEA_BLUERUGRAT_45 [Microbacterium phage BlueRugrat]UTN92910.1 hypothetical protein SEA_BIRDFEEDER_44 [Microbacterium phage Birdfeeder]UVK60436.1 hypothetical protein SEA_CORN21_45 [Microbacterium phage Corn21]
MAIPSVHVTDQTSGVAHVHIASISPEAAEAIGGGGGGGGVSGLNGVTGLWAGTQAQYDAIGVKNPNVVYVIKD